MLKLWEQQLRAKAGNAGKAGESDTASLTRYRFDILYNLSYTLLNIGEPQCPQKSGQPMPVTTSQRSSDVLTSAANASLLKNRKPFAVVLGFEVLQADERLSELNKAAVQNEPDGGDEPPLTAR